MFQSAKLASLLPRLPGDSEQKKAKAAEAKAVNEVIGAVMAMEMWRYAFSFVSQWGFKYFSQKHGKIGHYCIWMTCHSKVQ